MNPFRNLSLFAKVNLIIAGILLLFFALSIAVNYRQQRAYVLEEAVEKARIVAFEAIRAREYISDQLLEGKITLSRDRYGMIPVVASTRIGALVAVDLDYRIRQISDRYRNAKNAPDPYEAARLKAFYDRPQLREDYGVATVDGKKVFRYLRPFRADTSCLECHGDPETAPDFIKELFPPERDQAYHYRLGEIIGAASVTIPMDRLDRQIAANVRTEALISGGIFLGLITCLGLLTKVAVTGPLTRLGEGIREIIRTDRFDKTIPRRGRDEIGMLIDGFNEMMVFLREKTEHLEESEQRFRLLTETARDGILSFLSNGQIILFNRQAERMFGYSRREILGVSVTQLVHIDCEELHQEGVEEYLKHNAGRLMKKVHPLVARRRDGTPFEVELSLSVAESDGHLFYTAFLREKD